ncbi:MAG TPA: S-layer homology domain-containing protein, partial [Anaerovoracaceae bacterium]|nr:S-layer homology domain-containing protein [Anaerovoracaceae bacterium]
MGKNQTDKNQANENQKKKSGAKKRTFQIAGIALAIWLLSGAIQLGPESTSYGAVQLGPESTSFSASQRFKDLPVSHWAWMPIDKMYDSGIVKGYPDQNFKPEKPVTYGEYIKMATIILNGKDAGNELDTGNGSGENWAAKYYKKGLENSFYTEYDIPDVKLNWQMTRGDMALIISGLLEEEMVENYNQVAGSITDINSKTKHEYEIVKAYAMGILEGYPDGTFRPDGTLSRAEAAASLYRIIQKQAPKSISGEQVPKSISGVAGNMAEYWKEDWIEGWAESSADLENYKIVSPEEVELKIRVSWNGRLAGFDHTMVGFIYLIKDNHII